MDPVRRQQHLQLRTRAYNTSVSERTLALCRSYRWLCPVLLSSGLFPYQGPSVLWLCAAVTGGSAGLFPLRFAVPRTSTEIIQIFITMEISETMKPRAAISTTKICVKRLSFA